MGKFCEELTDEEYQKVLYTNPDLTEAQIAEVGESFRREYEPGSDGERISLRALALRHGVSLRSAAWAVFPEIPVDIKRAKEEKRHYTHVATRWKVPIQATLDLLDIIKPADSYHGEPHYTVDQVAEILGKDRHTVFYNIYCRNLGSVTARFPKRKLVSASQLREYIKKLGHRAIGH